MESSTIFIAQLAGPVMLVVGLGVLLNRKYFIKTYRHFENETFAVLMGGMAGFVVGLLIVQNHNVWDSVAAGLVSAIGWLALAKGVLLIVFPKAINQFRDMVADSKYFSAAAVVAILLGGYLSWVGYMA